MTSEEPRYTIVVNLLTGEHLHYWLPPDDAVVAAWHQERGDWSTWNYGITEHPPLWVTEHTVACGDWCALKRPQWTEEVKHDRYDKEAQGLPEEEEGSS